MKFIRTLASTFSLFALCGAATAGELIVLCAGAVKPALAALDPGWQARGGPRLQVTYAPAGELLAKLAAGEHADLVILPLESLALLEAKGELAAAPKRDLGAVGIGIAVREGAVVPDIATEEALKRALLAAQSLTFMDPTRGTSGKYFDEVVLQRLAIREAVLAKTQLGEGGMIAEKVARGEVEMAIQQMTELTPVAGIRIVGPLPASLQKTTVYAGAVTKAAASPNEAAALLTFLVSAEAQALFARTGFAPP